MIFPTSQVGYVNSLEVIYFADFLATNPPVGHGFQNGGWSDQGIKNPQKVSTFVWFGESFAQFSSH